MFAVWEPILPTDYSSPGTAVLARLSDPRVEQYWDKNHLFADKLGHKIESEVGQPQPKCCTAQEFSGMRSPSTLQTHTGMNNFRVLSS